MNISLGYWENFSNGNINSNIDNLDTLPITHNLDSKDLEYFINDEELILPKKKAPILNESLLFFYYGIPAYFNDDMDYPCIMLFEVGDRFFDLLNWSPIDSGVVKFLVEHSIFKMFKEIGGINEENFKKEFIYKEGKESLKFIKSHLKLHFKNNKKYLKNNSNVKCLERIRSYNQNLQHIRDCFFLWDAQKHMSNSIFEDLNLTTVDNRIKIIEGHYNKSIKLKDFKPAFCYVPCYKKQEVMKAFNLSEKEVKSYEVDINQTVHIIIHEGKKKALKFIESKKHKSVK